MSGLRGCFAIGAMVLVGCAEATAPAFATVVAEVVDVSFTPPGMTVKTDVTIANATTRTLHFNGCATSLERHLGGDTWQPVGGILCIAIGYTTPFGGMMPIPPRDFRRITLHLTVTQPVRNLDGTNRFRVRVQTVADFPESWWGVAPVVDLAREAVLSNEFLLDIP